MKHSLFALPALLRGTLFLAAASQTTFSVHDDLLAFPQYEVDFSEDFVSESLAQARLVRPGEINGEAASHLEQYRPTDSRGSGSDKGSEDPTFQYESMSLDGQRYLCSVPQIKITKEEKKENDTLSVADEEKELARAKDRGWELLSGMEGNCVYFISGWWSYKFCYNDGVRQFHQLPPSKGVPIFPPQEDPGVAGYTLGKYFPLDEKDRAAEVEAVKESTSDVSEARKTKETTSSHYGKLVQRGESRYLVQTLYGGTVCDLTGKGRKTEVQFHCNPQSVDRVSLIKETSTCEYLMVIQTPRLCHDVAFLPPQVDQPNAITCSPILAEEEVDDYKSYMSTLQKASASHAAASAARKLFTGQQIVGDIEIGAHNIVPEDLKLEKSAIVGGGKETYVDTVASSDGKVLGKEDLERLGLGDPKAVEQLKKKLEAMAQGQEWKLQVIDTPRGREYRGIIGSDDDEDAGTKKTKEGGDKKAKGEKEKAKETGKDQGEEKEEKGSKEEYYKQEL